MTRHNNTVASSLSTIIGTEQHYRASIDAVDRAAMTTREYIDYFRAHGHLTPSAIGKAARDHAARFDKFGPYASNSVTTLHRLERKGSLPDCIVKAVRWCWSIECLARYTYTAEGQPKSEVVKPTVISRNAEQAKQPGTPTLTPVPEKAAEKAETPKKLKSLTTLPVERVAVQMLIDLIDKGIADESWQEIADARKMLSGFLA